MAIQSDSMGFLRGVPQDMGEMKRIWGGIQSDIRAIRAALELDSGAAAKARRVSAVSPAAQRAPVAGNSPARSFTAGKTSAAPAVRNTMPAGVVKAMVAQAAAVSAGARGGKSGGAASQAAAAQRDGRGRFVAGSGGGGAGANSPVVDPGSAGAAISSGLGRIKDAIGELRPENEVDPTIKAFGEVAQPMARGYKALFGGMESKADKSRERWYRRFWGHMRRTSDDQARDTKAMRKSLKSLNDKPTAAGGGGGLLGGLGSLVGGGGGALAALTGFAKVIGGGALKRIPLIGGLLAGIGGLFEAFDSESSGLSRAEKDKKTGAAVGGVGGTVAGGLAGAKLGAALGVIGGPIGVAIGGIVGGAAGMFFGEQAGRVLGDTVGGWVTTLRDADIPGKIAAGWGAVTSGLALAGATMQEKAGEAFEFVQSTWAKVTKPITDLAERMKGVLGGFADALNEVIKEKFGVDVKAGLEQASQVVSQAKAKVAEVATKAVGAVADGAAKAGKFVQENTLIGKGATLLAKGAKNLFGNPRRDALLSEMDAQGITDPKERAMMLAQVDHESNGFKADQESFKYSSADRIMAVSKTAAKKGRPAIEAAMKQGPEAVAELMYGGRMGNKDPGDGYKYRGRGNIQITGRDNYKALGAKLGLDLENNPDLLLDPAIAAKASVQWWKDNGVGSAARAGDVTKATKIINGGANGLAHRQELYSQYLSSPAVTTPATAVAAATPSPAAAPAFVTTGQPMAGAAPKVPVQVASADVGAGRGFVNPSLGEPGQDLQDRKLAHLVTGGIST